jgi:hypothetical protein
MRNCQTSINTCSPCQATWSPLPQLGPAQSRNYILAKPRSPG